MEFKNLECNILYILSKYRRRSNNIGLFDATLILKEFSDIPEKHVAAALMSLDKDGLLNYDSDRRKLYLTNEGSAKIESSIHC